MPTAFMHCPSFGSSSRIELDAKLSGDVRTGGEEETCS